MEMLGGKEALAQCRTDQIMADAAYVILTRDSRARTGEFLIDEDVLKDVGVTDFEQYSCVPGTDFRENKLHREEKSYPIFASLSSLWIILPIVQYLLVFLLYKVSVNFEVNHFGAL